VAEKEQGLTKLPSGSRRFSRRRNEAIRACDRLKRKRKKKGRKKRSSGSSIRPVFAINTPTPFSSARLRKERKEERKKERGGAVGPGRRFRNFRPLGRQFASRRLQDERTRSCSPWRREEGGGREKEGGGAVPVWGASDDLSGRIRTIWDCLFLYRGGCLLALGKKGRRGGKEKKEKRMSFSVTSPHPMGSRVRFS